MTFDAAAATDPVTFDEAVSGYFELRLGAVPEYDVQSVTESLAYVVADGMALVLEELQPGHWAVSGEHSCLPEGGDDQ